MILTFNLLLILFSLFSACGYIGLMIYFSKGINNIYTPLLLENKSPIFISVVVCFRNEEHGLPLLLKSIVEQNYPSTHFEILLYNDASKDGSLALVKNMQAQFKSIKIICNDVPYQQGSSSAKKAAINHAALQSKADLIVVTDADCVLHQDWLTLLAQLYIDKKALMIAAPVAIKKENTWLNNLQHLELQALTAVTAGAIGNKNAVMCNGANMAFDRKIFLELDPYKHNLHISSGDDMFLLMAMQKEQHEKIYFLAHQNAIVYTQAKANFSDYLNQRIRWASKSKNYQNKVVKVVALLVLNYNAVILLSPIMFFIDGWEKGFVLFLSLILLKQLADGLILSIYSKKMKASINYFNLLLFQYLEALLTLIVAIKSIKGSYVWKGRKQHF